MIKQEDAEFYKENGYLLVKGVFNDRELEAMRTAHRSDHSKGRGSEYGPQFPLGRRPYAGDGAEKGSAEGLSRFRIRSKSYTAAEA
ncbi:hypothetical protein FE784_21505 [Paenibacillus hemerocallicola]|uniref:Phytanoyl-CoA dioxygenase family protein n=1 Tax=Paenibacillus hemerocallicola TaxID=1172614 RepID=A0A5C4T5T8_9BACL|nr:hypothetical protein [Paenibacillus hemerocallicola]TNJ64196.1 hypothetical protein FE784_21505 [Paenibacillus hemerocallicola]